MKVSERQLVERLRARARRHGPAARGGFLLSQGIGDDCAVLSAARLRGADRDLLITTDLFLEGVHFRRAWQPAASVGHKVLARGLSDIAAMGASPRFAFLSLALPRGIFLRWISAFFRGLFRLAERSGVVLAGGDTGASRSGIVADIMVIGEVPRGEAVLRSGARPGDEIWVSGQLGGAAGVLALLRKGEKIAGHSAVGLPFFYPAPRLALGRALRERGLASAMMDISDGLSIDLARLCQASSVGAMIDESAVPRRRATPLALALHGGEDFELLFTVATGNSHRVPKQIGAVPLTRIGRITARRGLRLACAGGEVPLAVRGFEHF